MDNQNYNGQPMTNNQNYNCNSNTTPNKKDNKMLFIILGVTVLIIVSVVVLIIVLNNNSSRGNTINDYENAEISDNGNTGNNNQQEVNSDNNEENSIAFKGFSIIKQLGYEYVINDASGLLITSNTYATIVNVTDVTLETFKSAKDQLVAEYTDLGMEPTNVQVSNYRGKEALTIEITSQGHKAIFYVIDAGNNYSFTGLAMNPTYMIDYNDMETSISLLSNAKYTGAYKVKTDDIDVIEFKDLFE